jgi:hypothetical protein
MDGKHVHHVITMVMEMIWGNVQGVMAQAIQIRIRSGKAAHGFLMQCKSTLSRL